MRTLAEFRARQDKTILAVRKKQRVQERLFIGKALLRSRGNVAEAAREMGVSDAALWERVKLLNMIHGLKNIRLKFSQKQGIRR